MKKQNENGLAHLVLLVVLALVAVGGSGYYVYSHQKPNSKNSETVAADNTLAQPLPDNLISVDQVKSLADTNKTDSQNVEGIDLENDGQVIKFKVHLDDGNFLLFNAKSGVLISKGTDTEQENDLSTLPDSLKPAISLAKARELALTSYPKGTVRMIKLQKIGGVLTYSVRFTDGSKVNLNADTGDIIQVTGKADDKKTDTETEHDSTQQEKKTVPDSHKSASSNSGSSTISTGSNTSSSNETSATTSGSDSSGSGGGGSGGGHNGTDD